MFFMNVQRFFLSLGVVGVYLPNKRHLKYIVYEKKYYEISTFDQLLNIDVSLIPPFFFRGHSL